MSKPTKLLNFSMIYLFLILNLSLSSCQKDSDLFTEALLDEIETENDIASDSDNTIAFTDLDPEIENTLANAGNKGITEATALRVFYVAIDGEATNDGLSEQNPIDIYTAFDVDRIQPGDLYWVKAGDYGKVNIALNQARKSAGTAEHPIGWIGYKNIPGDIEANQGPTISWEDYLSNGHDLDPSLMPTFSGDTSEAPNFLKNKRAIDLYHWKEYIVLKNFQIRHYEYGIYMGKGRHNHFDNIIIANNGYFSDIPGQGGHNNNLIGHGIFIKRETGFNKVTNCNMFNMAHTALSLGSGSSNNVVDYCISSTDNDSDHNPQDYFFYTNGKYNVFTNIKAEKLTESNHSGHGLCFNWGSGLGAQYNYAENVEILNTALHFDGEITHNNTVKNIKIYEDRDHYIYGCSMVVMDGAHDNLVQNLHLQDGAISFLDSGAHVANGNAGHNNIIENSLIENNEVGIRFGKWSTEFVAADNQFVNCTFKNLENLLEIERANQDNQFINCNIENVPTLWFEEHKVRDYSLDNSTVFKDSNFWNSELPSANTYKVSGLTQKQPAEN